MAKLLLSFDFEDWHQLVHRALGRDDWDERGHALERQTAAILDLLDELHAKATFFVLGMTAERHPISIQAIAAKGHELACHGYAHRRVRPEPGRVPRRRRALRRAPRRALGPAAPRLPRAAFSITRDTPWAYDVLAELGSATTRASTTRRASRGGSARCRQRPTGSSSARARDLGVPDHRLARTRPRSVGGGAYWRALPTPPPARAPGGRNRRTPTLCCTSTRTSSTRSRCGWRCRRARLRGSGCSAWKSVQRNPGRRLVADRIRAIAREHRSRATRRHMEKSSNATELVRDHFREKASSFDALYDEEHPLQRAVRPGC